jgi:hypothetical protein
MYHGVVGGGVGGAAVAGGGGRKEEHPRQWQVCHGISGVVAAKHLHGDVVGARGGHRVCCSVSGAAAGHRWR